MRPLGHAWYSVETPYSSIIELENTQAATMSSVVLRCGAMLSRIGSDAIANAKPMPWLIALAISSPSVCARSAMAAATVMRAAPVRGFSASAGRVDHRAGRVARGIRKQPDDRLGHLVGAAGALHRHQRRHLLRALRRAAGGVDVGFDDARAHRVDAD